MITNVTLYGNEYEVRHSRDDEIGEVGGITLYTSISPFWMDPRFLSQFDEMLTYDKLREWLLTHRQDMLKLPHPQPLWSLESSFYNVSEYTNCEIEGVTEEMLDLPDQLINCYIWQATDDEGDHDTYGDYVLIDPPPNSERTTFILDTLDQMDYKYYWISFARNNVRSPDGNTPSEFYRVMNYTFSPELVFLSAPKERTEMYVGMELEVSTKLSAYELQHIVTQVHPQQEVFFYMKSDTSITGRYHHRYEIVTRPITPRRLRKELRILFTKLGKLCDAKGYDLKDVFDTATDLSNGIHFHVNKRAFVQNTSTDKKHMRRFLAAFNQWDRGFQQWIQRITKRPVPLDRSEYCYVHPGLDGYTIARRLRRGPAGRDRHAACHDAGNTIEVRVWQGIVDLHHILACLELTVAMFEFTVYVPRTSYGTRRFIQSFNDYVLKARGFRYAKEVLKQCV